MIIILWYDSQSIESELQTDETDAKSLRVLEASAGIIYYDPHSVWRNRNEREKSDLFSSGDVLLIHFMVYISLVSRNISCCSYANICFPANLLCSSHGHLRADHTGSDLGLQWFQWSNCSKVTLIQQKDEQRTVCWRRKSGWKTTMTAKIIFSCQ